jgi:tetratricopeptide (TPR) repeat protein
MKKELVTWMIILTFFSCNRPTTKDPCKEFKSLDFKIKEKGQQDRDKSLKMLNEVIRKQSGCIDAHLTRADLYVDLDSLQLAEEDYKRVLQIDADNIYAPFSVVCSLKEYNATGKREAEKIKKKLKGCASFVTITVR